MPTLRDMLSEFQKMELKTDKKINEITITEQNRNEIEQLITRFIRLQASYVTLKKEITIQKKFNIGITITLVVLFSICLLFGTIIYVSKVFNEYSFFFKGTDPKTYKIDSQDDKKKSFFGKYDIPFVEKIVKTIIALTILIFSIIILSYYTDGYRRDLEDRNNIGKIEEGSCTKDMLWLLDLGFEYNFGQNNNSSFIVNNKDNIYAKYFFKQYDPDEFKELPDNEKKDIMSNYMGISFAEKINTQGIENEINTLDYYDQLFNLKKSIDYFENFLNIGNKNKSTDIIPSVEDIKAKFLESGISQEMVSQEVSQEVSQYDITRDIYKKQYGDIIVALDKSGAFFDNEQNFKSLKEFFKLSYMSWSEDEVSEFMYLLVDYVRSNKDIITTTDKYISYQDMLDKMSTITSKQMVIEFFYHIYNIRNCVDNIILFNNRFFDNMSITKNQCFFLFNVMFTILSFLGMCLYLTSIINKIKQENQEEKKKQGQTKQKPGEQQTKQNGNMKDSIDEKFDEILGTTCGQTKNNIPEERQISNNEQPVSQEECEKPIETKYIFIFVMILMTVAIINVLLHITYYKKGAKKNYNKRVMNDNCFTMSMSSSSALTYMERDFERDVFEIMDKTYNLSPEKKINLKNANIRLIGSGEDSNSFHNILKLCYIDDTNFPKFNKQNNLYEVYKNLIEIVDAYKKCNSIFALSEESIQFPWTSVFVYCSMIIICGIVIYLLISDYDFFIYQGYYKESKYVKYLLKSKAGGPDEENNTSGILNDETQTRICEIHDKIMKDKQASKACIKQWLYIGGGCVVILIALIIMAVIVKEFNTYSNSLYSSKLFTEKQCTD